MSNWSWINSNSQIRIKNRKKHKSKRRNKNFLKRIQNLRNMTRWKVRILWIWLMKISIKKISKNTIFWIYIRNLWRANNLSSKIFLCHRFNSNTICKILNRLKFKKRINLFKLNKLKIIMKNFRIRCWRKKWPWSKILIVKWDLIFKVNF